MPTRGRAGSLPCWVLGDMPGLSPAHCLGSLEVSLA
jgi:hypothetical protein